MHARSMPNHRVLNMPQQPGRARRSAASRARSALPCSLPQLPTAALRSICTALPSQADQQALRCTCRQLAARIDSLIGHLRVCTSLFGLEQWSGHDGAQGAALVQQMRDRLTLFPAKAVVRTLTLSMLHAAQPPSLMLPALLPALLYTVRQKFDTLVRLELYDCLVSWQRQMGRHPACVPLFAEGSQVA